MSKAVPRTITSLIDTSHPVINTLGNTFGGYLPGRRTAIRGITAKGSDAITRYGPTNPRIDIVDEKLCDDIINYLAPTLEPYKGCTIIDAHPGACVWSKKLNDFLKPKKHLLMEPEERYVKPFIQPLLKQPNSTFKHTPHAAASENGILYAFKTALADQSILPSQPQPPDSDPRLRELDTSVLVTGNLARTFAWPNNALKRPVHQSMLSLQQLTKWSGLSHDTFNSQGLVRMLWWLPDEHKTHVIPRLANQISAINIGMQLGAQMTEVVGVEPGESYALGNPNRTKSIVVYDRMPLYDAEVSKLVRQRMEEAGMTIPQGRTILGQENPASNLDPAMRSPVEIRYHTVKELKAELKSITERMKAVLPALKEVGRGTPRLSRIRTLLESWGNTVEWPQCFTMASEYYRMYPIRKEVSTEAGKERRDREGFDGMTGVQVRIALLLDLELRIINLEAHYKALEDRGEKVDTVKPAIIQLGTDLRAHPIARRIPIPEFINRVIPDTLAFFADPPLMAFDRRPYEPLHTSTTSFWPRLPLTLVDIVPTGRDLTVPEIADRYEATRTASELLKYLFTYQAQSLPSVLDKIAPNAAQDLIPQVAAISDPRKGGRLNPESLTVRMLSEEMVEGLVRAWFEWPFKLRLIDLALAADSSSSGEVEEGGEGTGVVEE